MMKEEFEDLIGKEVPIGDYEVIEFVYAWHPHIDEMNGKQQMAALYMMPKGMEFIEDMYHIARRACEFEKKLDEKRAELERVKHEYYELQRRMVKCEF